MGSMVSRLQGGFGEWRAGERAERATAEFVPRAGFKRARGGEKGGSEQSVARAIVSVISRWIAA